MLAVLVLNSPFQKKQQLVLYYPEWWFSNPVKMSAGGFLKILEFVWVQSCGFSSVIWILLSLSLLILLCSMTSSMLSSVQDIREFPDSDFLVFLILLSFELSLCKTITWLPSSAEEQSTLKIPE